jgi:hypothetical protein
MTYRPAIEAMTAVLATVGNASSLHGTGRAARRRMEESRETLAKLLGARPSEVVFTAGGTESDNLAIKGIYWARRDAEPRLQPRLLVDRKRPRGAGVRVARIRSGRWLSSRLGDAVVLHDGPDGVGDDARARLG